MFETVAANTDRNFSVQVRPCAVTKQFDRCIVVHLGKIAIEDEQGEVKTAEVEAAFSREGLQSLMADLESVPDPLDLPDRERILKGTPYQWAVVTKSGEHYQQFPPGEEEKCFSEIHLPDIVQFWIIPRQDPDSLPWYGLVQGKGFVVRRGMGGGDELLDLPHPGDEPFEWHYYRRNTLTFLMSVGQSEAVPPHVTQVLGWRLPRPDGDIVFEIGVEADGNYQVWKREPLENSPYW